MVAVVPAGTEARRAGQIYLGNDDTGKAKTETATLYILPKDKSLPSEDPAEGPSGSPLSRTCV